MPVDVLDDLLDLVFEVAELAQSGRDRAVDDLQQAAADELLVLHQRQVGLDARGVAVHGQADGPGGGDDHGLRVPIAVLLAQPERLIPGFARSLEQVRGFL